MARYLLSSGKATYRLELYILDQFKVYLTVNPGDIPGDSTLGFDFTLTNIVKSNLKSEVSKRVGLLIQKIQMRHGKNVDIKVDSLDIVSEERADLTITVTAGGTVTDNINLTLFN